MHSSWQRISPLAVTTIGAVLVVSSLVWYQVDALGLSVMSTRDIGSFEIAVYATLAMVFIGLVFAFAGANLLIRRMPFKGTQRGLSSYAGQFSSIMANPLSRKVFFLSALSYGVLFGFASSTLVFQPGATFSEIYGITVPSLVPVVCCGSLGQMPQLVVYITQQLAIVVIPENLILLFIVSWLVGLNGAITSFSYANRSRLFGSKWTGGLGAMIGLFTVCPSCAGFLLLGALGLGGAVGLTLVLSSLQALFIAAGIPILAVTPVLAAKRIRVADYCSNSPESQESA